MTFDVRSLIVKNRSNHLYQLAHDSYASYSSSSTRTHYSSLKYIYLKEYIDTSTAVICDTAVSLFPSKLCLVIRHTRCAIFVQWSFFVDYLTFARDDESGQQVVIVFANVIYTYLRGVVHLKFRWCRNERKEEHSRRPYFMSAHAKFAGVVHPNCCYWVPLL